MRSFPPWNAFKLNAELDTLPEGGNHFAMRRRSGWWVKQRRQSGMFHVFHRSRGACGSHKLLMVIIYCKHEVPEREWTIGWMDGWMEGWMSERGHRQSSRQGENEESRGKWKMKLFCLNFWEGISSGNLGIPMDWLILILSRSRARGHFWMRVWYLKN